MYILIGMFAGIGLLLVGARLIGSHVKRLGSRRFRRGIGRAVRLPVVVGSLGVVLGAVMLSANAVVTICVNAVGVGLVKARQIVPLLIWSNVGTAALVLVATRDVHLLVALLMAAVAVLYYFEVDRKAQLRSVAGLVLGAGLLFFGIDLVREGAQSLHLLPLTQVWIDYAHDNFVIGFIALAFLAGIAAAMAAGSSALVAVVTIMLAQAGLLSLEQGMAIIYGAGIGSAIALWRSTGKRNGTPRQLAALEIATKLIGAVVLVPLFAVELRSGVPLVRALVQGISPQVDTQLASVYLIYQLLAALIASLARGPLYEFARRRFPETVDENLSKPRFLNLDSDIEPQTGVLLVEREQQRLIGFIRDSLDVIRPDAEGGPESLPDPQVLHDAAKSVGGEVASFVAELMDTSPPRETAERLAVLRGAQEVLDSLADEVHALVEHLGAAPGPIDPAIGSMVESLHLVLTMLLDELEAPDDFQRSSLMAMTSDRSKVVDKLLRELTRGDRALTKPEQETLFAVTTCYERSMELAQRFMNHAFSPTQAASA